MDWKHRGTPGDRHRIAALLWLARTEFGWLSKADRSVIRCAAKGYRANFDHTVEYRKQLDRAIDNERKTSLAHTRRPPVSDRPRPISKVRANVIRWLVTNATALEYVAPSGVEIEAAEVPLAIDLEYCRVQRTIVLENCWISGGMRLTGAELCTLDLSGTVVFPQSIHVEKPVAIQADGLVCSQSIILKYGFRAVGVVVFARATVRCDFVFEDGCIAVVDDGTALDLSGSIIQGTIFLREIDVVGEIELVNCTAGYLCDGKIRGTDSVVLWPKQVILTDFRYASIFAGSPMSASDRLVWLDNYRKTYLKYYPQSVPDPQPYRWLAEVMKKQGHEDEARTVLRVCAQRRMIPLVKRAFREGPAFPRRYLCVWAAIVALFVAVLWLAERDHAASTLTFMFAGWAVPIAALSQLRNERGDGLRDVARCVEAARVAITQGFYFLVVGHGYARWRAAGCALAIVAVGVFVFGRNSSQIMQPAQAVALKASADYERRPNPDNEWVAKYPKFDPVIYSIDTLLPLVSFHQEDHWTPSGRGRWGWFVKIIYLPVHISAGWVIATLFVASFTRLMRQEG